MNDTNLALHKIYNIMERIEPILYDIKDGTLKRVAESNFVKSNRRMKLDDMPENMRTTAAFNDEEILSADDNNGNGDNSVKEED